MPTRFNSASIPALLLLSLTACGTSKTPVPQSAQQPSSGSSLASEEQDIAENLDASNSADAQASTESPSASACTNPIPLEMSGAGIQPVLGSIFRISTDALYEISKIEVYAEKGSHRLSASYLIPRGAEGIHTAAQIRRLSPNLICGDLLESDDIGIMAPDFLTHIGRSRYSGRVELTLSENPRGILNTSDQGENRDLLDLVTGSDVPGEKQKYLINRRRQLVVRTREQRVSEDGQVMIVYQSITYNRTIRH